MRFSTEGLGDMGEFDIDVVRGDISDRSLRSVREVGIVALDTETGGLDFSSDRLLTCQIAVPGSGIEVVQFRSEAEPHRLVEILESDRVFKIFHHATFDLRFMQTAWHVRPRNIGCTKIMSKIVNRGEGSHSLEPLVHRYLGVALDKSERVSDWAIETLSESQLAYAANDVRYLLDLYVALRKRATEEGVLDLIERSFDYIPTRVELDLMGVGDVFTY